MLKENGVISSWCNLAVCLRQCKVPLKRGIRLRTLFSLREKKWEIYMEKIQKLTDTWTAKVDEVGKKKEKEIMEV